MEIILNIILEFLKSNPFYFFTNILFMGIIPINDIYMSRLYGNLFESIQNNKFTMKNFTTILVVMAFVQLGYALMDLNDSMQIPRFQQYCKEIFIRKIFNRYENEYKELLSSDLLSKILRSQHIITSWYSKLTTFIVPHIFEFTLTVIYFTRIDLILGGSFALTLLVFIVTLIILPTKCGNETTNSDRALSELYGQIDDMLTNYLSVYKEQKLDSEIARLRQYNETFVKHHHQSTKLTLRIRMVLVLVMIIFLFVFIYRCYTLLKSKTLEKALFYSLVMMITHLIGNLLWMIDLSRDILFDYGIIKNSEFLQQIAYKHSRHSNESMCRDFKDDNIKLKVEDVHFKYPSQKNWVLNGLNFEVKYQEKVAIVGDIGSGKSTLIKQLLRLNIPTKGKLYLDGMCYDKIDTKKFYENIGFMPQMCILFNRSIIENITYDNPNIKEEQVRETIQNFGLNTHFSNLENGIHSLAGKNGSNLSGGQRQVVWFLKLYFKNPSLIIMDEPTASLDKKTKDLFLDIMKHMFKDSTIIMVTHDTYILQFATRTFRMDNGNLVEETTSSV